MRPALALIVSLALIASLAPSPVGAADARLTVDGIAVAPDRPTTGEPTTVTADVALSVGSDSPLDVDAVVLRNEDGDRLTAATDPGSLSPGDGLTVDLVTEFEEAGRHDLTVLVRGTDEDGATVRVERSATVVVEDSPPGIEIDADLVAGVDSPVAVEVGNPAVEPIRNVEVVVLKGDATADRAFVPVIGAGGTESLTLSVRPTDDRQRIGVLVSYTTATGDRQRTLRRDRLPVEPLEEDVGIEVREVTRADAGAEAADGLDGLIGGGGGGNGLQGTDDEEPGESRVEVAVTNFGNVPVSRVVVEPSGEEPFARQFVGGLAPGETGTTTLDLSEVPSGELEIGVSYRLDRQEHGVSTTYDHRPETAALALTGVDVQREGDRLRITGNAGNTGEGPVTGAVVAVGEAEGVRPAYPQRDYFVGTVDGSEFAPFELTAAVDENASTVPIEVTYRVDGRPVTETERLPLEPPEEDDDGRLESLSPLAVGLGVGASVLVGVAILVPLYWRRNRR